MYQVFKKKFQANMCYNNHNKNKKNIRFFQKDINDKSAAKEFIVSTTATVFKKIAEGCNHFYETWNEKTNVNFAIDMDVEGEHYGYGKKLVKENIKKVIAGANKYYKHTINVEDIIVLATEKQVEKKKESYHIIFKGLKFENIYVAGDFYERLDKDYELDACDHHIYGMTCLRTCYSTKMGKNYPLRPVAIKINKKKTIIADDYEKKEEFWVETLITSIRDDDKMISKKQILFDKIKKKMKKDIEVEKKNNRMNTGIQYTTEQIKKLLNSIPENYRDDYSLWYRTACALCNYDDELFDVFHEWSKKSKKHTECICPKMWAEIASKTNRGGRKVTIATLFKAAKDNNKPCNFGRTCIKDIVIKNYKEIPIRVTEKDKFTDKIKMSKLTQKIYRDNFDIKLLAVQSEKGTGKTYNLMKSLFSNNNITDKTSMLFLSSRRTFGNKLLSDLDQFGFKLYSDIKSKNIFESRIICQIDSLHRIKFDKYDYVVVDECESLARYLTSSHFTKNNNAKLSINILQIYVQQADHVIIMDADLSDRALNFYKNIVFNSDEEGIKITKDNYKVILNEYKYYQNYTVKFTDYNSWLIKIDELVSHNKKLIIPMASNNKAKDLKQTIRKNHPEKSVLLIHKETSEEDKMVQIYNVDEEWTKYDIVIYTPSVCMGVSYDVKNNFDYICAYGCHGSLGAQEFCQMLHRCREPKNKVIYLTIDNYREFVEEYDKFTINEVEEMITNPFLITHYDINTNLVEQKLDKNFKNIFPYKQEPLYDLYVRNCLEMVSDRTNFGASLFGYIKYKGYKLEFSKFKGESLIPQMKENSSKRKEEETKVDLEKIMKAKLMSEEDYMHKKNYQADKLTDSEIYQIKKYNLQK